MTSAATNAKMIDSKLVQQDPQDAVQLTKTLRRIKRRLLLEQCGVALPYALQNRPQALYRSASQDSADTSDSTFRVAMGMGKIETSIERAAVSSGLAPASPSVE